MKRVVIESPYAGAVARNTVYARLAMKDCLKRGEAPFLSHLLYTQCLDDTKIEEREVGLAAGFAWGDASDVTAVYADFGVSGGMKLGIERAVRAGRPVVTRRLFVVCCEVMWSVDAETDTLIGQNFAVSSSVGYGASFDGQCGVCQKLLPAVESD